MPTLEVPHPWVPHFDRLREGALRWLRSRGHDEAGAADLWQQVIAQVLASGTPPDPGLSPEAYLWTVTRRAAGRARARWREGPTLVGHGEARGVLEGGAAPGGAPSEDCIRAEERRAVRRAVEALPPPFRQVVVRRYFQGHSVARVAADLAIPDNTVASRTHRALRLLGIRLERLRSRLALPLPAALLAGALRVSAGAVMGGDATGERAAPAAAEAIEPAEPIETVEPTPDGPHPPTRGFPYGDTWVPHPEI